MERAMFINQMPPGVRTALASSKARTNDELCDEANTIHEEFCLADRARATPRGVSSLALHLTDLSPWPFPLGVDAV